MSRKTLVTLPLLVAVIFSFPSVAWANAGTPLMWVSAVHLMLANAFIGAAEGMLLKWLFRLPASPAVWLMILANYVSAWVGYVVLLPAIESTLIFELDNVRSLVWMLVGVAYVLTILLEWPFVAIAFRQTAHWLRRSIVASLVVQTASYAALFVVYWNTSGTSLLTDTTIVALDELAPLENVVVYYIGDPDGNVYRTDLGNRQSTLVRELPKNDRTVFLALDTRALGDIQQKVVVRRETDSNEVETLATVAAFAEETALVTRGDRDPDGRSGPWRGVGTAPLLGVAQSDWELESGFWPLNGLHGTNTRTNERVWLSLETPFVAWAVRHPVQLANDYVLFQLGDRQICMYDLATKRLALVARGRSPVVMRNALPVGGQSDEQLIPGS